MELETHRRVNRGHMTGVESNDMIQRLHDDSTISQTESLAIDKRLLGNIIILIVTDNIFQTTIIAQYQTRDAIAGTYPNIVLLILDNGMNHIIQQSITTCK